jgi:hypothetical protein
MPEATFRSHIELCFTFVEQFVRGVFPKKFSAFLLAHLQHPGPHPDFHCDIAIQLQTTQVAHPLAQCDLLDL